MNARNLRYHLPSLIGMILTLAVAYGLDRLIQFVGYENTELFTYFSGIAFTWIDPLANLILAACLLLLFWHVTFRAEKSKWINVTFLLIGSFILLYEPVTWIAMTLIRGLVLPDFSLTDLAWGRTCLADASATIAIMGLLGLFLRRDTA
ncbi:MAG: hypothetical protein ABSB41_10700 [Anaerolineales bacterium]|jgi:hypothetical protein